MGTENNRSSRRDRRGAEVWSDEAMRGAKPYPMPEVPGPETPTRGRSSDPARTEEEEPGLVRGNRPECP